ncbi:unnamed protein product [Rangifer tarandus platyrhynchus]|uniref:Uncharacterized protein n=1 Tax=Rangifer tarandus platyrhynchus TaxID=3082113 RepID=A0AC59YHN9_RANTA
MAVHHPGYEAPPMRQGLEVQGSPARSVVPQVAASSFWITKHGEVARYGCPSPRIRSPAHEAGARGARQSGKKCGAPGCCQFFLDHRARYVFSCPKTCREFQVSWRCCLSGSPCGGTIPLVDKPGGSEFPGCWRTPRSLALPESGTAYPVKVGSEPARARIDDDTLSCIPWKI